MNIIKAQVLTANMTFIIIVSARTVKWIEQHGIDDVVLPQYGRVDPKYLEKLPAGLRINITGGEPMLREDIEEIYKKEYDLIFASSLKRTQQTLKKLGKNY